MRDIYLVSDTHFFHENIIKYDSLPFQNIKEMNSYIIDKWNETVKKNDLVLHLGDFFVGGAVKEMKEFIFKQLNGDIILIKGNHDKKEDQFYLDIGFKDVLPFYCYKQYFFCHYVLELNEHMKPKTIEIVNLLKEAYELNNCKYVFHGHQHNPKQLVNENHYNCVSNKHDFKPINFKNKIEELGWIN